VNKIDTFRKPFGNRTDGRGTRGSVLAWQHAGVPAAAVLEVTRLERLHVGGAAVDGVDLCVSAGECVAVLGANGSGKSTLLRLVTGRDLPSSGQVRLQGDLVTPARPGLRAAVASAGDDSASYPDLTVREHLELVATAHGAGAQVGVTVEAALGEWELAGCADAFPSTLSAGQLQKLFLAAAFVRPRELLVLDEPEQRLDLRMRRRLASRLQRETADGVAVLVATHSRELAEQVADRVLVLEQGRVTHLGATRTVLADLDRNEASGL